MITEVQELEKILAQMVQAQHPKAFDTLGIPTEYIENLLRPIVHMLREDAVSHVQGSNDKLLRQQREIDEYKDKNYRLTIENRKLRERIAALEGTAVAPRPQATSENSSLPPSKDPIGFKRTVSLRKKSDRPSGGQKGHKGHTLEQAPHPNKVVECLPRVCPCCGKPVYRDRLHVTGNRQVIDLPLPIVPITVQYDMLEGECECGCHLKGEFPAEATAPVAYGPNIHALVGYMSTIQSIPFKRMVDILNNVFGLSMSQGTVSNILTRMRKKSSEEMERLRAGIEGAEVVGADETSHKVKGEQYWIWVFQTDAITYMFSSKSRGKMAIDEHFPEGLPGAALVTDRHSSYFNMDTADHQVCLAHLLRNLIYLGQLVPESDWPGKMMELIRDAIHKRHISKGLPPDDTVADIEKRLDELMDDHPKVEDQKKQEHLDNFILNLRPKKEYLLTFLKNEKVPSDNNASERAVRPVKTKMKVSGQFKSKEGSDQFVALHSIIQTARKQGEDPFAILAEIARK